MTAQFAEQLHYQGRDVAMHTPPLSDYFAMGGFSPSFDLSCTALWRGYIGRWEIVDSRLYLLELHGTLRDGTETSVATLFPDFPDRVFAHWYSGTIHIPRGKRLDYVHMGYDSTFEQDLFLDVERGVVKNTRARHNGTAESGSALGDALFPHGNRGNEGAT
ncbi:hypothetical protein R0381_002586 [Jeongeupia wiesaeckerbachi]|uniref:hypothetical protein n=1 Tax=Jeongeupia wiesaeckerbachi TaxID=3051218 RepID=UPI003D8018D6